MVSILAHSDSHLLSKGLGQGMSKPGAFSVSPGTYQYYVRDANGCIASISNEITVDPLTELSLNLDSVDPTINCNGDNTGSIVANAQGGLGNYVYTLEDPAGNTINATQDTPGVFTELFAGTYIIELKTENGTIVKKVLVT